MRLFIAEKPSLGRAIASGLPTPLEYQKGYIKAANGDIVTWCVGHILELAKPETYNPRYKQWKLEDLPIQPVQWQWIIKDSTRFQFNCIEYLVKKADVIVHAGDPDREGQRLVDEVLEYLKVNKPVKRVLINDLETSAVKAALGDLRENSDFKNLSSSALARERLDWLFGINCSRAYTLLGRSQGREQLLSVGRVQTPLLGLVVKRDQDIENFKPTPYFDIAAIFVKQTTPPSSKSLATGFEAKWVSTASQNPRVIESMDESSHLLDKAVADEMSQRLLQNTAVVKTVERKKKKTPPPLPYSLSALQIDAANQLSLSATDVLAACQNLYEQHRLITYPRSDCTYLPTAHHALVPKVFQAISHTFPREVALAQMNLKQKTKAWDDSKVSAHHAITPTVKVLQDISVLNVAERDLYRLICFRYLVQFYDDYEIEEISATIEAANEEWLLSEKHVIHLGWKKLYVTDKVTENTENIDSLIAKLRSGDSMCCEKSIILEKKTTPPTRFTDATLLSAMLHIANFVKDPEIKKTLRETDGLGTEATRASIIDTLFKRGYLNREGKSIISMDVGRRLISLLPEIATTPDLTAQFESALEQIRTGESNVETVIEQFQQRLNQLMEEVKKSMMQ